MATNSSKFFTPHSVFITSVDGVSFDLTSAVGAFSYYEDIYKPFISASMVVMDSGQNFIGTLPIQGGEIVTFKLENVKKQLVTYEFCVYKVYNRQVMSNKQTYCLAMLSKEAMINEKTRCLQKQKDLPDQIVRKILTEDLGVKADNIITETSKFKINMFPNGRKPHAVIQSLMARCVPKSAKFRKGGGVSDAKPSGELGTNATKSSGTAGYLFFQNKDGFVFESMDRLCSDGTDTFGGKPPIAEYYSRPAVDSITESSFNTIEFYKFIDEIDIMDKMNNGIYSTHMCYFDLAAQKYEEYNYNMKETFDTMSHLGSQIDVPKFQKELSSKPSRVMTILLDSEMWYDGAGIANPEEDGDAEFPDFAKYYTAQAIGRRYLMENQKLEIMIPGNSDLKVGDKVKVMLPNVSAEALRNSSQYDEENSGTYLIAQLSHNYQLVKESGEPEFTTMVNLIRDTYGMKEYDSNVK
jgi:hypothetical protein